jgi:hypothetical protein
LFFWVNSKNINLQKTTASNGNFELTNKESWQLGSEVNIDSDSVTGSIEIDLEGEGLIEGGEWFTDGTGNLSDLSNGLVDDTGVSVATITIYDGIGETAMRVFESDICVTKIRWWRTGGNGQGVYGVQRYDGVLTEWDPEEFYIVNEFNERYYSEGGHTVLSESPSGEPVVYNDWYEIIPEDPLCGHMFGFHVASPAVEDGVTVREFELYGAPYTATHTTAATQIDGQEGSDDKTLIEWTSFTPTQTVPANTTLTYQFRTSGDGATWTEWTGNYTYSGSPIDLTGLEDDRYLQVKATLSNTDGVSTPQIDDYTINFHNNQKPNQPTAQTAIIGN